MGWYASEQTSIGAKLYASNRASCHGAKLEGGAGPGLSGISWSQKFVGTKLLTIRGEIHGPIAQYAGTTFTEKQSLDSLAFLLQQNSLPAGTQPLGNTRHLPVRSRRSNWSLLQMALLRLLRLDWSRFGAQCQTGFYEDRIHDEHTI